MVVVPSCLLVVLQVVLLLLLGILLLRGILLLQEILLLWEILLGIFSWVDHLVGVEWVAVLVIVLVLHLVDWACLALVLVVELLRRRWYVFCVWFVDEFLLPPLI